MKAAITVIIIVLALSLIGWILGDAGIHPAKLLPFLGGHSVGAYDVGGLLMLFILILGLRRLWNRDEE